MMLFLLHTEPAGKMNRIFDIPGQNEMAEILVPFLRGKKNWKMRVFIRNIGKLKQIGKLKSGSALVPFLRGKKN